MTKDEKEIVAVGVIVVVLAIIVASEAVGLIFYLPPWLEKNPEWAHKLGIIIKLMIPFFVLMHITEAILHKWRGLLESLLALFVILSWQVGGLLCETLFSDGYLLFLCCGPMILAGGVCLYAFIMNVKFPFDFIIVFHW